jgi:hypothetical protein
MCSRRIRADEPGEASQIDGQRDEVLLDPIVDGALDGTPIGVAGLDEPSA